MLFCCFIYQGASLSRTVSTFIKPNSLFIAWGRTLAQPFPLGQAECFPSAQRHMTPLLTCGVRLPWKGQKKAAYCCTSGNPL